MTGVSSPPLEAEQQSEYLLRGGRYASCGFPQEDFLVIDKTNYRSLNRISLLSTKINFGDVIIVVIYLYFYVIIIILSEVLFSRI